MNRYNLLCILYVCFGSIFYGYDSGQWIVALFAVTVQVLIMMTGCTTSILGYESFLNYFELDSVTIGAFGSAYYGGSIVGMMMNWYFSLRSSCIPEHLVS